ncbi:unnamed protein product [Closterium sp. Yama58-4]|nr:unnamed protein product [Closterium sp. Yama58-4]
MIRRDSVSSCTPYSALRVRNPFHSLAPGGTYSSITSAGDGISSDSSSNDSTTSSSTASSNSGSSSSSSSGSSSGGYSPLGNSAGAEGEGTAQVVAEAGDSPAAAEGSLGEEFSAMAEGTGDAQVAAEGGEGGTVEVGGSSGGGGGANAETPGLQTPLEQLWQHIKELPDSNHAMPIVRAWESNGNTVDMRLATQLIKKLKNHRRPKQAAEGQGSEFYLGGSRTTTALRTLQRCVWWGFLGPRGVELQCQGSGFCMGKGDGGQGLGCMGRAFRFPAGATAFEECSSPCPELFVHQPFPRLEVDYKLALFAVKSCEFVAEWFVQQPGFPRLEADYQLALSAVIRARNVAAAQALFLSFPQPFRTEKVDWLRQQGVPEGVPSFNARLQALLAGRRRAGMVAGIAAIMDEMRSKGFTPITITFNIILAGLGRAGQLKEMEYYLGQMENYNLKPDLATMNALISAYVTHGEAEKALEWERRLKTSGAGPDRGTYAAMLKAYGQSGQVDKLETTWSDLLASNVPLTRYGCDGDGGALSFKRSVPFHPSHPLPLRPFSPFPSTAAPSLFTLPIHCRSVPFHPSHPLPIRPFSPFPSTAAPSLFTLPIHCRSVPFHPSHPLPLRPFSPFPSTAAPSRFSLHARSSHLVPCRMLHKARIEGYGLAGDVAKAEQAFQELRLQQAPVTETFNSLVFAYAHNHLFSKAKDTIIQMDAAGMRPDGITFLHLLRGYLSANQIDDAVTTLHDAVAAGAHRARMKLPFNAFAEVLGGFVEAGEVGKVRELVGLARTMYRTDSNLFNSILTAIVNDWRKRGGGAGEEAGSGEFVSEVQGVLEEMIDAGVKANGATEEILHSLGLSYLIDQVGLVRAVQQQQGAGGY